MKFPKQSAWLFIPATLLVLLISCEDENLKRKTGSFEDTRDGQIYKWVKIGDQTWMAENLNIGTCIDGSLDQTDNQIIEKYCYEDEEGNCDVYGGLYQWDEMMQYLPSKSGIVETTRGICPDGWHIPTDEEWEILLDYLGGRYVAGDKLKEEGTKHWREPNAMATNIVRFTALPGGYRTGDGNFSNLGDNCYFRASGEINIDEAWLWTLDYHGPDVSHDRLPKILGFSVRCIKDK
jgi:uncharacterized protein (TIGR02145 family)